MSLKFVYKSALSLANVSIDPDNERQTHYEPSFIGLRDSVSRRGVITPIGVELLADSSYSVIFGNRRVLAAKASGHKTIRAKVYSDLSKIQRSKIQIVENATKERIPRTESAENLWFYYLRRLSAQSLGVYSFDDLVKYKSYWDIPANARSSYSMADFSRRVGYSEDKVAVAFRFVNAHPKLKDLAYKSELRLDDDRFVSYTTAAEIARISDKDEQLTFFDKILSARDKKDDPNAVRGSSDISKKVTKYLHRKIDVTFGFSLAPLLDKSSSFDFDDLERRILASSRVFGNVATLMRIDTDVLDGTGGLLGDRETTRDVFNNADECLSKIEGILLADDSYFGVVRAIQERGMSVKDQILSGAFNVSRSPNDSLRDSEYKIVPIDLVYEDETQPRKTFDKTKLENLAATIKEVGILSPPLVKPMPDGRYRIIVGHRRTKASRIAGLGSLEVLCVNINDELCREIQYEEDIFERVILAERAEKLYKVYLMDRNTALETGSDLSVRDFARKHSSIGATTIINGILFAGLPNEIKSMHYYGLLSYSTAVALAEDIDSKDNQIDWAVEASLLRYNTRRLRSKIVESKTQRSFEDSAGLFGGASVKTSGRRRLIKREVDNALNVTNEVEDVMKRKKLPRTTVEAVVTLLQKYKLTKEISDI